MAEVNKYINKKRIIDENMAKLKEIEKKLSGKSLHVLLKISSKFSNIKNSSL